MKALLYLLIGLHSLAFVSIENPTSIEDPRGLLKKVDQTLGQKTFEEVYTCDREVPMKQYVEECSVQCLGSFCITSICIDADIPYQKYALGCGTDSLGIYNDLGGTIEFDKKGFDDVNRNPIRLFLMDLQNVMSAEGRVVLTKIEKTRFTVSSKNIKVDAYHLRGRFIHKSLKFTESFLLTYSPELPMIAQPLRFRTGARTPKLPDGGATWFRYLGLPEESK
ncbi:MAG: hypothetical protein AAF203_08260 [Pseudomonadota bacterium]